MANIKSKIKRNKQNIKRYDRNKAIKSRLKTATKKALEAPTKENINEAVRLWDKSYTQGVYKKNKVSRNKSRLQKLSIIEVKK